MAGLDTWWQDVGASGVLVIGLAYTAGRQGLRPQAGRVPCSTGPRPGPTTRLGAPRRRPRSPSLSPALTGARQLLVAEATAPGRGDCLHNPGHAPERAEGVGSASPPQPAPPPSLPRPRSPQDGRVRGEADLGRSGSIAPGLDSLQARPSDSASLTSRAAVGAPAQRAHAASRQPHAPGGARRPRAGALAPLARSSARLLSRRRGPAPQVALLESCCASGSWLHLCTVYAGIPEAVVLLPVLPLPSSNLWPTHLSSLQVQNWMLFLVDLLDICPSSHVDSSVNK
ncbi:uncharacterized protein PS065_020155 [Dugong dugon]